MPAASSSRPPSCCITPSLPQLFCRASSSHSSSSASSSSNRSTRAEEGVVGDPKEQTATVGSVSRQWSGVARILSLIAGCFVMSICGTPYAFGLYGDDLKEVTGFSQTDISLVSSIGDWGLYMGVLMGMIHDFCGPNTTSVLGSMLVFLGYFLMYLTSNGSIVVPPVVLGMFFFLVGQGSSAGYLSALVSNDMNWHPRHRGKIVGFLVSFFGLSSGILTLYHSFVPSFRSDHPEGLQNFLLFLSLYPTAILLLGGLTVTQVGVTEDKAEIDTTAPLASDEETPLMISGPKTVQNTLTFSTDRETRAVDIDGISSTPLQHDSRQEKIAVELDLDDSFRESLSPAGLLIDIRFYCLFFSVLFITAPGLVYINNISFFCRSLFSEGAKDMNVLVLSLCNASGRFIFGMLADTLIHRIPRLYWIIFGGIIMISAQVMMATAFSMTTVYIGSAVVGLAYGGVFSTWPCIVREIFGAKFFGMNFGLLNCAPGLGITVFGLLAGAVYDSKIRAGDTNCYGAECFMVTFIVLASVCALGCVLCYLLYVFDRMYVKRRRQFASVKIVE